ncbi:MAG: hypothetical protein R3C44_11325 [Chloroflexota bacterium]
MDLSADLRLQDAAVYEQWYGHHHPAPELLSEAVYGLTEAARDQLPGRVWLPIPVATQPCVAADAAGAVFGDKARRADHC